MPVISTGARRARSREISSPHGQPPPSFRPERAARSGETSRPAPPSSFRPERRRRAVEKPPCPTGNLSRHFDRSAGGAQWRNLPAPRATSLVISTGAPKARSGETSLPHGQPPPSFRPERRRRAVEKPPCPTGNLPRHFDRSAGGAQWRNLPAPWATSHVISTGAPKARSGETSLPHGQPPPSFRPERRRRAVEKPPRPTGTRFLHSAVLRTAPVEMTKGGSRAAHGYAPDQVRGPSK